MPVESTATPETIINGDDIFRFRVDEDGFPRNRSKKGVERELKEITDGAGVV